MFYSRTSMALFMAVYCIALVYTGVSLAEFNFWSPYNVYALPLWLLFGLTLPLGLFQEKYSTPLYRIGGVALAFVLHFSVAFLLLDLWKLFAFTGILPHPSSRVASQFLVAANLWIAYGVARAQRIVVRPMEIELPSSLERSPVVLAIISDLHAGGAVDRLYLNRLRKILASYEFDLLLLPGDIIDGEIQSADEAGLFEFLESLEAPLGKYAVLGNHDIYAGAEEAVRLLESAGVCVLQDEVKVVDNAFLLAGRLDPRGRHFGLERVSLETLLKKQNTTLPIIVLDHTPQNIKESFEQDIVLQISGHTHGGQVFPFNYIMKLMYGIASGTLKKNGTTLCVSSGTGLWTMPLRTVTDSEVILYTCSFKRVQISQGCSTIMQER